MKWYLSTPNTVPPDPLPPSMGTPRVQPYRNLRENPTGSDRAGGVETREGGRDGKSQGKGGSGQRFRGVEG